MARVYRRTVTYSIVLPDRGTKEWVALFKKWRDEADGEVQLVEWRKLPGISINGLFELVEDELIAYMTTEYEGSGDFSDAVEPIDDQQWLHSEPEGEVQEDITPDKPIIQMFQNDLHVDRRYPGGTPVGFE
jgi:hypothetical protein